MSVAAQHPLPPATLESPVSPISTSSPGHNRARSNIPDTLSTPPIPPPRISSNQRNRHNHPSVPSDDSSTERVAGCRHVKHKADAQDRSDREWNANDHEVMDKSNVGGGMSRRGGPQSPNDPRVSTAEEDHDRPSTAIQSNSDVDVESSLEHGSLTKESSTIINQVALTDPSVDLDRERACQLEAQASPAVGLTPVTGLGLVSSDGVDDGGRGGLRSRPDYSTNPAQRRKEMTFGQYVLGQTIGEGEFGKVKLGWKRDGSVQVAIKLVRRESLGANPAKLPKIYREISILRDLSHPNIVRLLEMVETDRHIGLIMEYASGGELFDHILKNRYLKDQSARRLFAQLVSGVGYLHKKGIVHRDLKLENLLLDRNRNIIITDFGFANTFNPNDELGEEIEYNLTNRDFVKRMRLDKTDANGMRRGDLMQTSCGSPCYAAPELVVSDSLYTGRKVDVWSCGVILVRWPILIADHLSLMEVCH
jgi:protein-serine/threonine kinase